MLLDTRKIEAQDPGLVLTGSNGGTTRAYSTNFMQAPDRTSAWTASHHVPAEW